MLPIKAALSWIDEACPTIQSPLCPWNDKNQSGASISVILGWFALLLCRGLKDSLWICLEENQCTTCSRSLSYSQVLIIQKALYSIMAASSLTSAAFQKAGVKRRGVNCPLWCHRGQLRNGSSEIKAAKIGLAVKMCFILYIVKLIDLFAVGLLLLLLDFLPLVPFVCFTHLSYASSLILNTPVCPWLCLSTCTETAVKASCVSFFESA